MINRPVIKRPVIKCPRIQLVPFEKKHVLYERQRLA